MSEKSVTNPGADNSDDTCHSLLTHYSQFNVCTSILVIISARCVQLCPQGLRFKYYMLYDIIIYDAPFSI